MIVAPGADLVREVRVEPDGTAWGALAQRSWERAKRDPACLTLRGALGLPTDRPVLMTGHQPGFWHAGILTKYLSVEAAAERCGGAAAWVVVDQDDGDAGAITAPARDANGAWKRAEIRLLSRTAEGAALCGTPASAVMPWEDPGLPPDVRAGVERAARALERHADARTRAEQLSLAGLEVLRDVLAQAPVLAASELLSHETALTFVLEMERDAERSISAYNRAIEAHPDRGMSPMRTARGSWELPVWRLGAGGERGRVWSGEWHGASCEGLAPRALLMTAILRRYACDLFVHGTGGWAYDRVTEAWIRDWRHEEIAPMALASASVSLDLGIPDPLDEREVARRVWRAHHARHTPGVLRKGELQVRKRSLVRAVEEARERGEDASQRYGELTSFLRSYREEHREGLDEIQREAESAMARAHESALALDRTWACVLHPLDTLRALRSRVRERFGVSA